VSLASKDDLRLMSEIWYAKRAIFAWADAGRPIDLMVNLHNTETNEYMETNAIDGAAQARMQRFFQLLSARSSFDLSKPLAVVTTPATSTNALYAQKKVPVVLMEQRIARGTKLGRAATIEDRKAFGAELVRCMAEAAQPTP
jgi:hypothetical protein